LPSTAELVCVKRDEFPDAHRRPVGHALDAVRHPVVSARPVQLAHRHHMPDEVVRQSLPFQLSFPLLRGMSTYVTTRFSASENSCATAFMSSDRGPVSS
jgi:hypothetical protein